MLIQHMVESTSIQRDLNRLEKWTDVNLITFTKVKFRVLHLQAPAHSTGWEAA